MLYDKKDWQRCVSYPVGMRIDDSVKDAAMCVQANENHRVSKTSPKLKVRIGYKRYNDYSKIYCLDFERSLLAVQALGKDRIRFTMPQYNYSEIMLLSLETALANIKNGGGRVLLEKIEL
jgi:hypothetical protein